MGIDHFCGKCNRRKPGNKFNKEEVKKPDEKRVCNDCGPPMPKDLNCLTVVQIKEKLVERGESDFSGKIKKAVLIARLRELLDQNEKGTTTTTVNPTEEVGLTEKPSESPKTVDGNTDVLTRASIMSFKVADLKKELKKRGLRVSGLKVELQERLAEAEGLSLKESDDACLIKEIESDMKMLSFGEQQGSTSNHPVSEADIIEPSPNTESKNLETGAGSSKQSQNKESKNSDIESAVGITSVSENDENEISVNAMPFHWKRIAPTDDCETKVKDNKTYFWCQKCKSWTASHNTMQHVKKSKKKNKKSKKAIPLVPCAPGGRYMGLPACVTSNPLEIAE